MNGRFFLDTNILVYTFDPRFPEKQQKARRLVSDALTTQEGIISFQVVQEFLNVASRKFSKPLSWADSRRYLDEVLAPLCEIFPSVGLYQQTIDLAEQLGYSFYDSLVIAAALEGGCNILYSEDLQHQQAIQNLTIINPF
jgi:predicted nucleic acid-binding protein